MKKIEIINTVLLIIVFVILTFVINKLNNLENKQQPHNKVINNSCTISGDCNSTVEKNT